MAISNIIPPLLLLAYVRVRGVQWFAMTWGGWTWESLREWGQFLKLGISGLAMLCCQWWSYEIGMFVTGSIDKTQLAINSILLTILASLATVRCGAI